jgi:hypothetical protein
VWGRGPDGRGRADGTVSPCRLACGGQAPAAARAPRAEESHQALRARFEANRFGLSPQYAALRSARGQTPPSRVQRRAGPAQGRASRPETVFRRALSLEGFRNPASDRVAGASHPGSREHLGLAVMSGEWIQHLHVRFSEIVCVSGDDDKIVNERRRCDQTVLYRHRFTGLAQFSQKLCPSKARERIP